MQTFDLILCMDEENRRDTLNLAENPNDKDKIKKLRDFDPLGQGDVPDPYYGGPGGFEVVFDIVWRSATGLLDALSEIKQ